MLRQDKFIYRPFIDLFSDSILFCKMARDANRIHLENAFSRSSILNSVLTLECCANCIIEDYNIVSKIDGRVNKFTPLEKYEFILYFFNHGDSLDFGSSIVQNISELISLRNWFVHAKSHKFKVDMFDYAFREYLNTDQSNISKTQFLKIPTAPRYWDKTHAKGALESLIKFLNLLFVEKLKFDPEKVERILFSSYNDEAIIDLMHISFLKMALKEMQIKIEFLQPKHIE